MNEQEIKEVFEMLEKAYSDLDNVKKLLEEIAVKITTQK